MADDFKSASKELLRKNNKPVLDIAPNLTKVVSETTTKAEPTRKEVNTMVNSTPQPMTLQTTQNAAPVHRNFKIPRELRTIRACVAIKPSIYQRAQDIAKKRKISFNSFVEEALTQIFQNYTD